MSSIDARLTTRRGTEWLWADEMAAKR